MKKLLQTICIMLMAICVSATPVLASSTSDIHAKEQMPIRKSSGVKINKKTATIYVGESVKLKITGTSKKVTWKSSDSSVAKVSKKGTVTGISAGRATITAKVAQKKYKCKIEVKMATGTVSGNITYHYNKYRG